MMPPLFTALLAVALGPMGPDAPAREPQMAANRSLVVMAFGAGKAIYFASSEDGGHSFSVPVKVADAGVLPLSRHRGPRITLAGGTIVITAVVGHKLKEGPHAHGLPSDGDLLVWRSRDGGKTWTAGPPINDAAGSASEGLHALASDGTNTLFAVWLDKRGGNGTRLFSSRSTDGGATWSKNVLVYESPDGSICECCHPSAAVRPGGELVVMWRNSLRGSRDLYLTRSPDGVRFSVPQKLGEGTWPINACPMDGGGLAASGSRIVTAWRRDSNLFLSEPGQDERPIGAGKDVALALSHNRTYVAWVSGPAIHVWIDGRLERLAETGAFPSLTALPTGGALAAWEENGTVQVRHLP